MEFLHLLVVAVHFVGLSLLVGTFIAQMRGKGGFNFRLMLAGSVMQLLSGLALYGLAMAGDGEVSHAKMGVKMLIALVIAAAALIGWLRQRAIHAEKSRLVAGGAVAGVGGGVSLGDFELERKLVPFFHTAGGLAVVNMLIAVFWR